MGNTKQRYIFPRCYLIISLLAFILYYFNWTQFIIPSSFGPVLFRHTVSPELKLDTSLSPKLGRNKELPDLESPKPNTFQPGINESSELEKLSPQPTKFGLPGKEKLESSKPKNSESPKLRNLKSFEQRNLPTAFAYHNNNTIAGKEFNISNSQLLSYAYLWDKFANATRETVSDFIFVTAASSNHYLESQDAIGSIQKYFHVKKIHYYDWGLTEGQKYNISKWCNVELKPFSFDNYPHLKALENNKREKYQMAKVFVIAESLKTNPAVFWIDASVRFQSGNMSAVYSLAKRNQGVVLFTNTVIKPIAVTPPGMYDYLPTDLTMMKSGQFYQFQTSKY